MYSRYRPATIFPALVLFGLFFPCSFGVVHSQVTGTNIPQHPVSTVGFRKLTIMTSRSLEKSSSFIGKKNVVSKWLWLFRSFVFRCVSGPAPPRPPWQCLPLCGCPTNRCPDFVVHHHQSPGYFFYAHDVHEAHSGGGHRYLKQSEARLGRRLRPKYIQICCHLYPMCGAWGRVGS